MSYPLTPYLVDIEAVRAALGSGDEALLATIVDQDPDQLADDGGADDELPVGLALRHLILGDPPVVESAYQYGYALEHLCRHFGEALDSDGWESIRGRCWSRPGSSRC